ncbi:hypothetical protein EDB83DRAFT_1562511 [Lactarius deliciosus]|nr:hypothetical protein EDB83DRAFT_1562511 [Lactarius deliciosus]
MALKLPSLHPMERPDRSDDSMAASGALPIWFTPSYAAVGTGATRASNRWRRQCGAGWPLYQWEGTGVMRAIFPCADNDNNDTWACLPTPVAASICPSDNSSLVMTTRSGEQHEPRLPSAPDDDDDARMGRCTAGDDGNTRSQSRRPDLVGPLLVYLSWVLKYIS